MFHQNFLLQEVGEKALQFPETPGEIVHPVLKAGEDRSKRSGRGLENYFVTLSFSAFSGKKLGSRKEKAFGKQLKIKSPSENDIVFALVKGSTKY